MEVVLRKGDSMCKVFKWDGVWNSQEVKANWCDRNIMNKQAMRLERWAGAGIPGSRMKEDHMWRQA